MDVESENRQLMVDISNNLPLVSVICTSYNHEAYIQEALDSLLVQDYPAIELLIIDNGSKDGSKQKIEEWLAIHGHKLPAKTFFHSDTLPYCLSFNLALFSSSGQYVIDLAGDDALLPMHVQQSVIALQQRSEAAACFSDVLIVKNNTSKTYYQRNTLGQLLQKVKDGDLYRHIVASNVLLSVSLVLDAEKLKGMGGYDPDLAYEDFDILVRLSRSFPFVFSDHIGVKKRILPNSFSSEQYRARNSRMLPSTLAICRKIHAMNRTEEEKEALRVRILFELKHALASANFEVAKGFIELGTFLGIKGWEWSFFSFWAKKKWDLSALYTLLKP